MTRLYDDPASFTDDALAGFLDVHRHTVTGVPGGAVRADQPRAGKVAVVVGGGSGHYPAFCGVVGPGFADGAVVGNIFTSPSAEDACSVARAAHNGGGVLFSTGNYAGDVMNFTLAQQRLQREGIDTRAIFVTDDIASAPVAESASRRGIAGDFVVFKIAGAAAEEGLDLDAVERIGRHANDRTRTLGVAFSGCTMPGAEAALFEVPAGMMGVGLGIHGEPGVSDAPLPRAADLARRLVAGVLEERPADAGPRVGAILNGLGTTKYEELFVVWRTVAAELAAAGLSVVEPEVGELVTSLDMAGCSLTLVYLDDELDRHWRAPATTPAYRKGVAAGGSRTRRAKDPGVVADAPKIAPGSEASRAASAVAARGLAAMAAAVADAEQELGRVDAVAGDGDHGRGMVKGTTAAVATADQALQAQAGVATLLGMAGRAWAAQAGGTSGVLWGAVLGAVGARLGDDAELIGDEDVADAIRAGLQTLRDLGRAELGDKTMVDALVPFVEVLGTQVQERTPLPEAWASATAAAETAAQETAALRPRIGRARPLAERSVGTPDAGALSLALCARAIGEVLVAGQGVTSTPNPGARA